MSTLLAHELDRSELLERVKILRTHGGRVMDVLRAGRGDKAAAERVEQWKNITRALADQTTTDNVGLLPASILGSPAVTASRRCWRRRWRHRCHPARQRASPPGRQRRRRGTQPRRSPVLPPPSTGRTSPCWRCGFRRSPLTCHSKCSTSGSASTSTAGSNRSSPPTSKPSCSPTWRRRAPSPPTSLRRSRRARRPRDYVVASMADTLTAAPTLAVLRQAGVTNVPTVIVTPNTAATLVVSSAAVVIAAHPVQVGAELDVVLLCRSVGAWASGVAGTSLASAVQVVA